MALPPSDPTDHISPRRAALHYLGESLARVTTVAIDLELPLTVTIGGPAPALADDVADELERRKRDAIFNTNLKALEEAEAATRYLNPAGVLTAQHGPAPDDGIDQALDLYSTELRTPARIIAIVLAYHRDLVTNTAAQPKTCSCGHVYQLGRMMGDHKADSIIRALARNGFGITPNPERTARS